jgi:hypothetical protein
MLHTSMGTLASMGRNIRNLTRELRNRIQPVQLVRILENMPPYQGHVQRLEEVVEKVVWEVDKYSALALDAASYRGPEDDLQDDG